MKRKLKTLKLKDLKPKTKADKQLNCLLSASEPPNREIKDMDMTNVTYEKVIDGIKRLADMVDRHEYDGLYDRIDAL